MRFYTCQVRCRISETSTVSQNWPLIAIDCWFGRTLSKNSLPKNWCLKKTGEFWFVRSIVVLQKCLRKSVDQRPRNSCNRRCRCQELNGILEKQPGPEVLEQLEQYQDWQQRHSTKKNPIETEGTGKLVTSWWLGLGIRFLDFLGYIHIWYTYIYIYFPWTQTWAAKQELFLFSEILWRFDGPQLKMIPFLLLFFQAPFGRNFVVFPARRGTKPFLLGGPFGPFQGLGSFSRNIFGVWDPHTNPKPKSAAHKKSQLRNRKNTKIQETYASKLKQMKAMHSELQTYQSQASLFVSRRFFRCVGKRGFFLWVLVKLKACRCGDRCGVV